MSRDGGVSRLILAVVVASTGLRAGAAPSNTLRTEDACARGQSAACQRWIALYDKGEVPSNEEARARDRFVAACEAGRQPACVAAARIEETGATPNIARAEKLAAHACDGDDAEGCFLLGRLLFDNDATHPAPALAAFRKACNASHASACSMAAVLLSEGLGATVDTKAAAELAAKGCKLGDEPGCKLAKELRSSR